jgi:hypothetical protein
VKKIISLFQRNYETDHLVRNEIVPGAEWVVAGEGVATRKYDGICCMIRDGKLYKRYEWHATKGKPAPLGFEPAQDPDPVTGDIPGWVPVGEGPEDAAHRDAMEWTFGWPIGVPGCDGTFELIGPKVQGNPDGNAVHQLLRHGCTVLEGVPRDFDGLKAYLTTHNIEGIVWHHPDGRMVKIKGKDFGIKRPR